MGIYYTLPSELLKYSKKTYTFLGSFPAGAKMASNRLNSYMKQFKLILNIDDVKFNANCTDFDSSLFKILSVSFPKISESEMLLFNLDIKGISCSGGSACSAGNMSGSHVLDVVCKDDNRTGVRFSFSRYNTKEEIDYTVEQIKEIFS